MTHADLVYKIIDNIEGGYYHPDMKSKLKNGDVMGNSGETMYGLDRKNGAPGVTTATNSGVKFWQLVDRYYSSHHGDTKYWNDKAEGKKSDIPASVGAQLKPLAADIIEYLFQKNLPKLSAGAQQLVLRDPALTLQFLYATYNGSGNFQKFADVMNAAYSNGERSAQAFWNLVQAARRAKGGLFAIGADKLDKILGTIPGTSVNGGGSGNALLWGGLAVGGALLAFLLFGKKSKKRR